MEVIKPYKEHINYPVFYDFEYDSVRYAKKQGVSINKTKATAFAYAFLKEINKGGYIPGLYTNIDFSNKKFFGCNFTNCTFLNNHSENLLMRMCFFDFAIFNDCNFIHSKNLFNSFSMATFTHTLYTSSDLVQNNFNGIKAYQCSFDDSDLLYSRFINATLVDTSFRNCNIKNTNFLESKRTNVSFKMSNDKEAIIVLTEEEIKNQKNS